MSMSAATGGIISDKLGYWVNGFTRFLGKANNMIAKS